MPTLFKIAALILGLSAAGLWLTGWNDAAFVTAVAGCVSFFISIRVEVGERRKARLEREEPM